MKRILSLLIAVVLIAACLISCNGDDAGSTTEPHVHQYAPADCLSAKRCSCGVTEGEKGTHSFANGACTVCKETMLDCLIDAARDPDTHKITDEDLYLKYITNNGNPYYVLHATTYEEHPTIENLAYSTELNLTQESLVSGVFDWTFIRSTYVAERNQFDNQYLRGTVTASEFTASTALTVAENDGFTDAEAADFISRVPDDLDHIIRNELIPLLAGGNIGLTIKDLGFAQYETE